MIVVFERRWFFLTQNKVNIVLLTLCIIVYCTCATNHVTEYGYILLAVNVANVETFNITLFIFGVKMLMYSVCIPIFYFYKCVMTV